MDKDSKREFGMRSQLFANAVLKTADGPKAAPVVAFNGGGKKALGTKLLDMIEAQGAALVLEHDFLVFKTGEGKQTNYELTPVVESSKIDITGIEPIDLTTFIQADPSVEDIEAALEAI
jgi:hypothetical protein